MHGGAVTLARLYSERYRAENSMPPQAIVVSDMLDLSTFQALTRRATRDIPMGIYFHENQFSYPASGRGDAQAFDLHYPFINYASALCADRLYFNSEYHRADFLRHVERFPARFPDFPEQPAADALAARSVVLPLGLDLAALHAAREAREDAQDFDPAPVILWNHRREHDKNPEEFFAALYALADRGLAFRVMVLGQAFRKTPAVFARARERLGNRIIRFAPAETRAEYVRLVAGCDLLPVTSRHDFFGAATVEAMAAGCYPLLPRRLAYPEHVAGRSEYLYGGDGIEGARIELAERLAALLRQPGKWRHSRQRAATADLVRGYDWRELIARYDREFAALTRC